MEGVSLQSLGVALSLLDLPPESDAVIGKTARLLKKEWDEYGLIAQFETFVREVAKVGGKISTNDMIRHATQVFQAKYWEENGGRPPLLPNGRLDKKAARAAAERAVVVRRQRAEELERRAAEVAAATSEQKTPKK